MPKNCRDGSRVRREAGLKHHARFRAFELGDLLLERHVQVHGAGDGAHRSRADAVRADRFDRGAAQGLVRGQAEIIVRAEIDDIFAVEMSDGLLLAFEHAQAEMQALGLQVSELIVQVGKRTGIHCGSDFSCNSNFRLSAGVPPAGRLQYTENPPARALQSTGNRKFYCTRSKG